MPCNPVLYTGAPTAATTSLQVVSTTEKQFGFNQSGQGQLGIGDGWGSSDGNMYAGGPSGSGGVGGQTLACSVVLRQAITVLAVVLIRT